jgi:hypothetical protein
VNVSSAATASLIGLRYAVTRWLHALGSREPPFLHDEVIGLISAAGGIPYVMRVTDEAVEVQLRTLGAEVMRAAARFAHDTTAQRARAGEGSAERAAAAG